MLLNALNAWELAELQTVAAAQFGELIALCAGKLSVALKTWIVIDICTKKFTRLHWLAWMGIVTCDWGTSWYKRTHYCGHRSYSRKVSNLNLVPRPVGSAGRRRKYVTYGQYRLVVLCLTLCLSAVMTCVIQLVSFRSIWGLELLSNSS